MYEALKQENQISLSTTHYDKYLRYPSKDVGQNNTVCTNVGNVTLGPIIHFGVSHLNIIFFMNGEHQVEDGCWM